MKPRLSNTVVVSSLLLLIACIALWVFSYPPARYLPSRPTSGGWRIRSSEGQLSIYRFARPRAGLLPLPSTPATLLPPPAPWNGVSTQDAMMLNQIFFERGALWSASTTTRHWAVHVRYSLLVLISLAALAAASVPAWRARRRRMAMQNNQCPTCGYDLRATPERCPECGMEPPSSIHPTARK